MIGSLFEDLQPIPNDEAEGGEPSKGASRRADADDSLLTSLPVVQKIVRRKSIVSWQSDASDLVQGVFLRLFKWRERHRQKSEEMSANDWQSFAARVAYNEINRHNSNNSSPAELSLESQVESAADISVEGQSDAEVYSLARSVWQETCNLSLRQRRAFIMHSQQLIIYFQNSGITDEEIAESLEVSVGEWNDLRVRIPMSDVQIADLIFKKSSHKSVESLANSIKKARYGARAKMRMVTDK